MEKHKNLTLLDFVLESNKIEGIVREDEYPKTMADASFLTLADVQAHQDFLSLTKIGVRDLEDFVDLIQPGAGLRNKVGMDVRVGSHVAPRGGPEIEDKLLIILNLMKQRGSFETHIRYEDLHPFMDGNGRSGRVVWLWQRGGEASLGFLHSFYYQVLDDVQNKNPDQAMRVVENYLFDQTEFDKIE